MLPCICPVIDHRWRHIVVRKKSGKRGDSRVCHWCPLWSITGQMHGNMESICLIQWRIKLCTHKSCSTSRKARESGAFRIWTNMKKAIWRHLWSIEIKAIPLVAMHWQRIVIGLSKSCHCQTWFESCFSWNENLQRKQNWTGKSTNLKENTG